MIHGWFIAEYIYLFKIFENYGVTTADGFDKVSNIVDYLVKFIMVYT